MNWRGIVRWLDGAPLSQQWPSARIWRDIERDTMTNLDAVRTDIRWQQYRLQCCRDSATREAALYRLRWLQAQLQEVK